MNEASNFKWRLRFEFASTHSLPNGYVCHTKTQKQISPFHTLNVFHLISFCLTSLQILSKHF